MTRPQIGFRDIMVIVYHKMNKVRFEIPIDLYWADTKKN
jgi:hypothetical protein